MHICWYDEYIERQEDDNIYQEEIEGHRNFKVFDGAGLTELAIGDVELLDEEPCPSKKCLSKSKRLLKRQERHQWLDARVVESVSDADDFSSVNYLLLF
jgi:hypothetical protein